jgi:hypothetical protein
LAVWHNSLSIIVWLIAVVDIAGAHLEASPWWGGGVGWHGVIVDEHLASDADCYIVSTPLGITLPGLTCEKAEVSSDLDVSEALDGYPVVVATGAGREG